MRFWERIRFKMDYELGRYDKEKTTVTLTFNKRTGDNIDSVLDIVAYTLRPISEWMKDLEIDIK
jgi:hypothetical protein